MKELLILYMDLEAFLTWYELLCWQNPYQVNMMLAGWDKDQGPSLYYLDYISTLHKVEKGGMGYGMFFSSIDCIILLHIF